MSIKAMTWAFSQPISGNIKVVLLALADFSNDEGECWPSIPKIAEKAYLSVRTIQRVILDLSDQGYLQFERRTTSNGVPSVSKYRLAIGVLDDGDKLSPYGDKTYGDGDTVVTPYEPSLRTVSTNVQTTRAGEKGTRVPEGFTPDDKAYRLASEIGVPITIEFIDEFLDYWRGVPGSKGVKRDWQATFRNQIRHKSKTLGNSNARQHLSPRKNPSPKDTIAEIRRRIAQRREAIENGTDEADGVGFDIGGQHFERLS